MCGLRPRGRSGLCIECRDWQRVLKAKAKQEAQDSQIAIEAERAYANDTRCAECGSMRMPLHSLCRKCWKAWDAKT